MRQINRSKRILSLMLCLSLVLSLFSAMVPVKANAAEDQNLVINMHDSYGDGWGNNAINIFEDGVLIGTATFDNGKEGTWSYTMDPAKNYEFAWVKGAWSSECSFDIVMDGVTVFSATISDCNLYLDGEIVYPLCEHLECEAVVTDPTCKKDGYTTYTCTKCGESFVGDETPATGHIYGDDDFCDVCGFDINSITAVITMNDSFSDGWNGNAILVFENSVLIETVTLGSGMGNGTWTYDLDRNKEYEFYWKLGNFPGECSFTISLNDELVYTATRSDCGSFKDNYLIYPPCQHVNCDAVVTPNTCTTYGYTTYTCQKCGEVFTGDIVPAYGHSFGEDSICDTCGFDKDSIIITMIDSYGDGWNGNAIEIYADGVLVGTATLNSGSRDTFVLPVDKSKNYTFHWVKGNSTYECSFEIMVEGETQFVADGSACTNYIAGQQVYPYVEYSGWTELGGKVYYFDPSTHRPVSYANRLPYPTKPLNGIIYAPNPEDVANAEAQGQTFIDLEKAWFLFDGFTCELLQDVTAIRSASIEGTYEYRYVVQGMIPWNVGLIYEMGYYWYFTGDAAHGGNVVAYGDVTVTRNFSDFDVQIGGVYTFDWAGHLCMYDGITQVNGALRYYENAQLMVGNGLTKVGDDFIYVLDNGELVVNAEYYVPANTLGLVAGTYTFDENGILLNPIPSDAQGAYLKNGEWYYFENGKVAVNKGMVAYNGGYIYVRSNGNVVMDAKYYIGENSYGIVTGSYYFDANGYMVDPNTNLYNGVVDGYYYVDGKIAYGAGLIEWEDDIYYVRSNGQVATGKYYVTNTNGMEGFTCGQKLFFDEDGKLLPIKNGVVDGYYYVNGSIAYGAGLIEWNGEIYYVRSNGQVATGEYYITTTNDMEGYTSGQKLCFDEGGALIRE